MLKKENNMNTTILQKLEIWLWFITLDQKYIVYHTMLEIGMSKMSAYKAAKNAEKWTQ